MSARIIVVEDEEDIAALIKHCLQSEGYRTCLFNTSKGRVCTILNADATGMERLRLLDLYASPAPQDVHGTR